MVEADNLQFPVVPIEVDVPVQPADVPVQADVPGPNPVPAEPAREPVAVASPVELGNFEESNSNPNFEELGNFEESKFLFQPNTGCILHDTSGVASSAVGTRLLKD